MKLLLTLAALSSIPFTFWAGVNGMNYVLLYGFLAFALLLAVANLDRIAKFKASSSGFEAETRDVINKAKNTISELQSLARIFASVTFSTVMRAGRYGGFEDDEKERIKESVLDVLKQCDVPESECHELLSDWYHHTEFDYVLAILGTSTIPQGFDDIAMQDEWDALRDFKKIPAPQEVKDFLNKWGLLDETHSEFIKDYEFYIAHRKHRRPEVWKARRTWGALKKS